MAVFVGKAAYLEQRSVDPSTILCTLTPDTLQVGDGMARYPVGTSPILDADSLETLVDSEGRRSYTTGTSYCPSVGAHVVMGYLPRDSAPVGKKLVLEYFDEGGDGQYPMTVRVVGKGSLYDSENRRVRS